MKLDEILFDLYIYQNIIMICPFEKNMQSPGAVGLIRNIFVTTPIS